MAEGKEIKFRFVVDEASARQVNKVLDDMIKRAQELGKTLSGLGGGGGLLGGGSVGGKMPSAQGTIARAGTQSQKVSFASILGQNTDAFKKMADTGGNAMKVMTDSIKRAIGDQQRELKGLDSTIANLAKRYEQLGSLQAKSIMSPEKAEAFFGGQRETLQMQMVQAQGRRAELMETGGRLSKMSLQARATAEGYGSVEEMEAADRQAAGLGGGGFMGRMRRMFGGGGGGGGGAMKVLGGVAAVAAAATTVAEAGLAINTSTAAYQADRNRVFKSQMAAIRGGDMTYGLANLRAQRQQGIFGTANAMEQAGSGPLSYITNVIGGGTDAIKQLAGAVGIGSGGGSVAGAVRALASIPYAAVGSAQQGGDIRRQQATMDVLETQRQAITPHQEFAIQEFQNNLGARIAAQRIMGVGGFGRTGKFDERGMAIFQNPYDDMKAQLESGGYSMDERMAAHQNMRSMIGESAAWKYGYKAMAASAAGFGGYSQLLGASARVGQGDLLARGAIGGRIDTTAGIALGQAVLGTGFDVTGTTSGYGTLAAIQNGMGFQNNQYDFNKVERAQAGLGFGSTITQGGLDPYQQARNLVSAININPGGGSYAQDYLANGMNMKQMIDLASGGAGTRTSKALGITSGMAQQQISNSFSAVLDRFVDQGGKDPMSVSIRKYRDSKMGISEYLQKMRKEGDTGDIENLGIAFSQLGGGPEEAGYGAAEVLSGMGGKLKTRKYGPGRGISGAEKDLAESRGKMSQDLSDTLKSVGDDVANSAKALPGMFKTFSGATADMSKNASDINTALKAIATTLTQAARDLDQKERIAFSSKAGARGTGR